MICLRRSDLKKFFEFTCQECKETFEKYTEYIQTTECQCGGKADKIISTPRISLEGISGSFPGAAAAWEKKHLQQLKKETKDLSQS